MRLKSIITLSCLWWGIGFVFAQSQPPAPTSIEGKSNPPNYQAKNDQGNSTANSQSVAVTDAPNSQNSSKEAETKQNDKSSSDRWLIFLTALLVVVEDRMTIFPARDNTVSEMNCATGDSFTQGQLAQLSLGTNRLVLGLEIKYRDIFDKWHETREYFAFTGQGGGRSYQIIPGGSRLT